MVYGILSNQSLMIPMEDTASIRVLPIKWCCIPCFQFQNNLINHQGSLTTARPASHPQVDMIFITYIDNDILKKSKCSEFGHLIPFYILL